MAQITISEEEYLQLLKAKEYKKKADAFDTIKDYLHPFKMYEERDIDAIGQELRLATKNFEPLSPKAYKQIIDLIEDKN